MSRRSIDLFVVLAVALLVMSAAIVGWETLPPVRLVAVLLVLFLPGYALVAAVFGTHALDVPERLLFSVGLSLAVAVLGGFVLNWSPWGLQARSWAILLGSVTLIGGIAALARRRFLPAVPSPAVSLALGRRQLLLLGLAGVISITAFAIARFGANRQDQASALTQLWLLPDTDQTARLGVHNLETIPISYSLQLTLNGELLQEWSTLELAPEQQWEINVTLPTLQPNDTVEALLYRTAVPSTVYRRVILRPVDQP